MEGLLWGERLTFRVAAGFGTFCPCLRHGFVGKEAWMGGGEEGRKRGEWTTGIGMKALVQAREWNAKDELGQ